MPPPRDSPMAYVVEWTGVGADALQEAPGRGQGAIRPDRPREVSKTLCDTLASSAGRPCQCAGTGQRGVSYSLANRRPKRTGRTAIGQPMKAAGHGHPIQDDNRLMLIAFNKPFGVPCQFSGPGPTLATYLDVPGVYPAGRLDKDSEGLVLLTDDGGLQARISSPRFDCPKTYVVLVERDPSDEALGQLTAGVQLNDGPTRPARVRRIDPPDWLWPRQPPVRQRKTVVDVWLEIRLSEGRNRQIRRMTAAVGHPTLRLVRQAIGGWSLDGLAPGQWRRLLADDLP